MIYDGFVEYCALIACLYVRGLITIECSEKIISLHVRYFIWRKKLGLHFSCNCTYQ